MKVMYGVPCDYTLSVMLLHVLVDADKVDLSEQIWAADSVSAF